MTSRTFIAIALLAGPVFSAESPPIPLGEAPRGLQQLIDVLRTAVAEKDAQTIYEALSVNYYIEMDFGRTFDPEASSAQNFSWGYQFDNSRLRPEYQNLGWERFELTLSTVVFERKSDGEFCTPHGALDRGPWPAPQLCFKLEPDGRWRIAGRINGGD